VKQVIGPLVVVFDSYEVSGAIIDEIVNGFLVGNIV
jgi:hypothetical protein